MPKAPQHRRSILISGASVAGPTAAFWLKRYGLDVTVVERAPEVRGGGYPIDIRGTAIDVIDRMGLSEELRHFHIELSKITFLDHAGQEVAAMRPDGLTGGEISRDMEVARGDLTAVLFKASAASGVDYSFNDSIASLHQGEEGVDVEFASGTKATFDLVIAADGLHSSTRHLVLGSEAPFHRYMGYCFTGFTFPNRFRLKHEIVNFNIPGRSIALYAPDAGPTLHAIMAFEQSDPPFDRRPSRDEQRALTADKFKGCGWETSSLIEDMLKADDLFFDMVSQIRLPNWSKGRVAMVGDSAHAPSFLSGQGTSLALVSAYVLAGEIARHADPADAFASYERICRPFIEANQALADRGAAVFLPATQEALTARNTALARKSSSAESSAAASASDFSQAYNALRLPDYTAFKGWVPATHGL